MAPAPAALGVLVLRDWFKECWLRDEPKRLEQFSDLLGQIRERFPAAKTWEFLPLVGLQASEEEFAEILKHPAARGLIRPKYSLESYECVLNALSALRSQTGHQMFQYWTHVGEGGQLPHESWEGGMWPKKAGYPSVIPAQDGAVEIDEAISVVVSPAYMPAINLSVGPMPGHEYLSSGDPVILAQAAVSETHLLVVAAGNVPAGTFEPTPAQPWARDDAVLSVGASADEAGRRLATYSVVGSSDLPGSAPDVVAFGGSAIVGQSWDPGTSYAAPRVTSLALLCQAAIAQVHKVWQVACGHPDIGIPLMGMGVIDTSVRHPRPRANLPGLPFVGVHHRPLEEEFRKLHADGRKFRFEVNPASLKQAIVESAKPMYGYVADEVGAGFVSLDGVVDWLYGLTAADVIARWTSTELTEESELAFSNIRPFGREGLFALAQVILMAKPIWVYDLLGTEIRFSTNQSYDLNHFNDAWNQARKRLIEDAWRGHADSVNWTDPT